MPYCRLYYHIIWATEERQPVINNSIEPEVHSAIKRKIKSMGGTVYGIDGTEDHVHSAVSIPPTVSVSKFVGEVKGASSYHMNHQPNSEVNLVWGSGYGVLTFRKENLEQVLEYIRKQKEHHASGKIWPSLETCEEQTSKPKLVKETSALYDPFALPDDES